MFFFLIDNTEFFVQLSVTILTPLKTLRNLTSLISKGSRVSLGVPESTEMINKVVKWLSPVGGTECLV